MLVEINYKDRSAVDLARLAIELTRDKRKAIEVVNLLYGSVSQNIASIKFCEQTIEIIKNTIIK